MHNKCKRLRFFRILRIQKDNKPSLTKLEYMIVRIRVVRRNRIGCTKKILLWPTSLKIITI